MAGKSIFRGVSVFLMLLLASTPGFAQDQKKFSGVELVRAASVFLVLKDANVRAKPETKSARVGRLKKGERVKVLGRAKGTQWFTIAREGKPVGFVYGTILTPLIEGRLDAPVTGTLAATGKPTCKFEIQFEGKTKTEGEVQETADYGLQFLCEAKKVPLVFVATMFITELPFRLTSKEIYQISVDLLELPDIEDGEISVVAMYDVAKSEVRFDSISTQKNGGAKKKNSPKKPAKSLPEALKSAVGLAFEAWPATVFAAIRKRNGS